MRIDVVGTCQVRSVAAALQHFWPDCSVRTLDIGTARPDDGEIQTFADGLAAADLIISQANTLPQLTPAELRARFGSKHMHIGTFIFRGYNPDLCYASVPGYQSYVAILSYLRGESAAQASANFNIDWFQEEGLLKGWAESITALRYHDAQLDIPLADFVDREARKYRAFYTINHPTIALVATFMAQAVSSVRAAPAFDPAEIEDPLATAMIPPIPDFIAKHERLPFETPQTYRLLGRDVPRSALMEGYFSQFKAAGITAETVAIRAVPALAQKLATARTRPSTVKRDGPYYDLEPKAFWRSGVAEPGPIAPPNLYHRKWPISPKDKIATAGSCFAQHIGRNLKRFGFGIIDAEPPPNDLPATEHAARGYGMYSARYGNIYTARQLLQLAREALGSHKPVETVWTNEKGAFFDALRPSIEPNGFATAEAVMAERAKHLQAVKTMLAEADVLVFTLGLTETWEGPGGAVYPTAPGVIAGQFDASKHRFRNLTFDEVRRDMQDFFALISELRGANSVRYLLTVSPVPLTATASGQHVMAATTYSKAVLRAVAGQFAAENEDVDYFPSFEIISNPWAPAAFFEPNLRSVTAEGIRTVMDVFAAAHLEGAPAPASEVDSVLCDEEAIDRVASEQLLAGSAL